VRAFALLAIIFAASAVAAFVLFRTHNEHRLQLSVSILGVIAGADVSLATSRRGLLTDLPHAITALFGIIAMTLYTTLVSTSQGHQYSFVTFVLGWVLALLGSLLFFFHPRKPNGHEAVPLAVGPSAVTIDEVLKCGYYDGGLISTQWSCHSAHEVSVVYSASLCSTSSGRWSAEAL